MTTRFALLRHEVPAGYARPSHWDLLLERDEGCWTWSLEELPSSLGAGTATDPVEALRLPDHRKHYLTYEGPVSGERGSVAQVAAGECRWIEAVADRVEVELMVSQQSLQIELQRLHGDAWKLTVQ